MVLNFLVEAEQTKVENVIVDADGLFLGVEAAKVIAKRIPKFRPDDDWVAKITCYQKQRKQVKQMPEFQRATVKSPIRPFANIGKKQFRTIVCQAAYLFRPILELYIMEARGRFDVPGYVCAYGCGETIISACCFY